MIGETEGTQKIRHTYLPTYLPMVRDIDRQKDQKNEEDERMIGEIDKAEGKVMKWWF